jgi:hypothetical protein
MTFAGRSEAYARAYAAGGPGCDPCRDEAGRAADARKQDQEGREHARLIEEVLSSPSKASLNVLFSPLKTAPPTPNESARLLPVVRRFIEGAADADILTLRLTKETRFFSRSDVAVQEMKRVPAIQKARSAWLAADGSLYTLGFEHRIWPPSAIIDVAVERAARPPKFVYRSATYGWDNEEPEHWGIGQGTVCGGLPLTRTLILRQ